MTRILPLSAVLLAMAAPVLAAGGDSTTPPTTTSTTTKCEKGQVFDEKTAKCLDAKSEAVTDDDRYEAARELAYNGKYDRALLVLATAENQNDPRILNYKGFTHRKMGDTETAMGFYQAALNVDPDYILARSYMGQGLAAAGDLAGATEQLEEIALRGGQDTWAYASLMNAIGGVAVDY
ncbi:tetratricopeptide repeat protein [Vannielia litorea]|uniref:Tetratricopeptide repeat-containing protein n=1 Tax=Vannielia litorea TaxID=1217970 RepID=A0A1N6IIG6_9RHOB|nr:tetratricopeptide repeat protein [Vannielia litorea]SIO31773.1 Tetratricopeptide repeat-containing protein [Vannielia litorea]